MSNSISASLLLRRRVLVGLGQHLQPDQQQEFFTEGHDADLGRKDSHRLLQQLQASGTGIGSLLIVLIDKLRPERFNTQAKHI